MSRRTKIGEGQYVESIVQLCTKCRALVSATMTLTFSPGCMLVADISVCDQCGNVLWNWKYDTSAPPLMTPKKTVQLNLF